MLNNINILETLSVLFFNKPGQVCRIFTYNNYICDSYAFFIVNSMLYSTLVRPWAEASKMAAPMSWRPIVIDFFTHILTNKEIPWAYCILCRILGFDKAPFMSANTNTGMNSIRDNSLYFDRKYESSLYFSFVTRPISYYFEQNQIMPPE